MLLKIKENNWNITEEDKYMLLNDIENWDNHWSKYCFQVARENRTLSSFLNHAAIGKTRQDSHAQGISLLSAHMSKGTEFDVVFIIGLCEGIFPDYRAIATGNKAMEQERNNMYVAVTRAKRLCYLSYPKSRIMPWGGIKIQSPSRFIQDSI